jgi:exosortase A-associated hydrolase 2
VRVSAGVAVAINPFFLDGTQGRLFALEVAPERGLADLGVLFCAPFAEELNRTRRAVQLAARRMAALGCRVLLLDLYGTGDSDGEFAEASWQGWRADLEAGIARLSRSGSSRLALWGVRLGAAMALEVAASRPLEHVLLWQPVANGALFLNQFLRLRIAADMLAADGASSVDALRAEFAAGASVEIAGYTISPDIARALDAVDLARFAGARLPIVDWLEGVAAPDRPMSVASRTLIERWQGAGVQVRTHVRVAQPFWGTPEIVVPDGFIDESERIVREWTHMESFA